MLKYLNNTKLKLNESKLISCKYLKPYNYLLNGFIYYCKDETTIKKEFGITLLDSKHLCDELLTILEPQEVEYYAESEMFSLNFKFKELVDFLSVNLFCYSDRIFQSEVPEVEIDKILIELIPEAIKYSCQRLVSEIDKKQFKYWKREEIQYNQSVH